MKPTWTEWVTLIFDMPSVRSFSWSAGPIDVTSENSISAYFTGSFGLVQNRKYFISPASAKSSMQAWAVTVESIPTTDTVRRISSTFASGVPAGKTGYAGRPIASRFASGVTTGVAEIPFMPLKPVSRLRPLPVPCCWNYLRPKENMLRMITFIREYV